MISEQLGLKNCEFEAKDSVRQQLVFHNWSNYRMHGQFGPPVLDLSKSFEERSITQ